MAKMKRNDFINQLKKAAGSKTLYILGCIGAPMTPSNKSRYTQNYQYNKNRAYMINAASDDTFGFDCVCLVKSILWGWNGDKNKVYGGATYASNGVPDYDANMMIKQCSNVSSTGWDKIEPGEFVWKQNHCGVYIGNGKVIECTPNYTNGVCYTSLGNVKKYQSGNWRLWTKHGKLPYVDYSDTVVEDNTTTEPIVNIAYEVIRGEWGVGKDRKNRLTAAGYDYYLVQEIVNKILTGEDVSNETGKEDKSIDDLAYEVIGGEWGVGEDRKNRLTAAGYNYEAIQNRVNELLS